MRKTLLTLLLNVALIGSLLASHIVGGVINVTIDDSTNVATFSAYVYRDVQGIPFNVATVNMDLVDPSNMSTTVPLAFSVKDTISNTPFLMERYKFVGSVQLSQSGFYTASYQTPCCRNAAVLNANPSAGALLETSFTHTMNTTSSTPVFLTDPVGKFPKDTLWTYDPMPYDADGDSLHWSLGGNGYIPGYTLPSSNPGGALSINAQTGVISWDASQLGVYLVGIFIDEYDQGSLLGTTYHEIQVIVVADTSQLRVIPPNNLNTTPSGPVANFIANSSNSLTLSLTSDYSNANLSIEAFGEPLQMANSNASFTVSKYKTSDSLVGVFNWNPDASLKGEGPFRMAFRFSDGSFTYDYSVLINVSGVFSVAENTSSALSVYPNPASGTFFLKSGEVFRGENLELNIYSTNGQKVFAQNFEKYESVQDLPIDVNLPQGLYIIQLQGGKHSESLSVIIE